MKKTSGYYKKEMHFFTRKNIKKIPVTALMLILCVIFLSPFLVMLTTSLKTNADAFQLPVKLWPRKVIWDNYPEAMEQIPFLLYFRNTIIITLFSVAGQLLSTPLIAYSLENQVEGRNSDFQPYNGNDDDSLYRNDDSAISDME